MAAGLVEPMTITQMLDRAFRVYRRNVVTFVVITAMLQAPVALLGLVQEVFIRPTRSNAAKVFFINMGAAVLGVLIQQLCLGCMAYGVSRSCQQADTTIAMTLKYLWSRLAAVLGAAILVTLRMGLALLLISSPTMCLLLAGDADRGVFGQVILVTLPLFGAGVWLTIMFTFRCALVMPAVVVEGLSAQQGLRRSRELARGNWGLIFTVGILLLTLYLLLYAAIVLLAVWIQEAAGLVNPVMKAAIYRAGAWLEVVAMWPVTACAFSLLYFDIRSRQEGYDLELAWDRTGH